MARNKKHKAKFASKGEVTRRTQGRAVKAEAQHAMGAKATTKRGGVVPDEKTRQMQRAVALRDTKRAATLSERRLGSSAGPPRIVGAIAANESANVVAFLRTIDDACNVQCSNPTLPHTIISSAKKQRITLFGESSLNEQVALDIAKVADIVILVLDVSSDVQDALRRLQDPNANADDDAEECATATTWFHDAGLCITDATRDVVKHLNAQGCPTAIVILQGLSTYTNSAKRNSTSRVHQRYFTSVLSEDTQVMVCDSEQDASALLWRIQVSKLRHLHWREMRPYFLAEHAGYTAESQELVVEGYLRGSNLSPNQLVHITNCGTYQVSRICVGTDPQALRKGNDSTEQETEYRADEALRESLESVRENDTVEREQTWPTDEEIQAEEKRATTKGVRVPVGVSEYQAAWYEGAGGENLQLADEPSEEDAEKQRMLDEGVEVPIDDLSQSEEARIVGAADVLQHERMTEEEREAAEKALKSAAEDDEASPDEIDTPFNIAARLRFAKYHGMKGFHKGEWNVDENLPVEYARIFKLRGFQRIRACALEATKLSPVESGQYVKVYLMAVPEAVGNYCTTASMVLVSGLLQHEQKWSCLHFEMQKNDEYEQPIKSKTTMLAHIGFRKLFVSPLFSDISPGDRTKYARFWQSGDSFRLATFFGPVSYTPCPILLFEAKSMEEQTAGLPPPLVAFGGALPPNPDMLILKRVVLTGRIGVIYKRVIVVKHMFHNDQDVSWFQPVDLYTRRGARGKITKPVGTHGLFKAQFNNTLMQHDTVCMDLYKRVFPKWKTVPYCVGDFVAEQSHKDQLGGEDE